MKPTVEMGPRLARVFADIGDKIDATPDDAVREVTDLLRYVDGQALLNKLVGYMVSCVPKPEPEPASDEDDEDKDDGPTHKDLINLDLEREEDEDQGDGEFQSDDEPDEPEIPRDPPPTPKQVKQDGRVKSRSTKPKPKTAG